MQRNTVKDNKKSKESLDGLDSVPGARQVEAKELEKKKGVNTTIKKNTIKEKRKKTKEHGKQDEKVKAMKDEGIKKREVRKMKRSQQRNNKQFIIPGRWGGGNNRGRRTDKKRRHSYQWKTPQRMWCCQNLKCVCGCLCVCQPSAV